MTILSNVLISEEIDSVYKESQIVEIEPYQFSAHIGSTYHILINKQKKLWENFVTYGIHFDFPSDFENLKINFGIEAGQIDNEKSSITISLLYTSLVFTYEFKVFPSTFSIKPLFGLTSTTICLIPNIKINDLAREALHPTRQFESEFGLLGGIEPILKIKKIVIGIPVYGEVLLSYKEIITANFALTLGVVF